jgi:putative flippase GtrA
VTAGVRLFASKQFVVFLLVGGTAALVNFLSGALVRSCWTSYSAYVASVTLGFVLGTVVSFFLNRRFTFTASDEAAAPQAFRFVVVALGSVVLSIAVASLVLWAWELAGRVVLTRAQVESLGHVSAIGVSTVYNFLAMKFFAFRRRR